MEQQPQGFLTLFSAVMLGVLSLLGWLVRNVSSTNKEVTHLLYNHMTEEAKTLTQIQASLALQVDLQKELQRDLRGVIDKFIEGRSRTP